MVGNTAMITTGECIDSFFLVCSQMILIENFSFADLILRPAVGELDSGGVNGCGK